MNGFIYSRRIVADGSGSRYIFQGRLSDGRRFSWHDSRTKIVFFLRTDSKAQTPAADRRTTELRTLHGDPVDALYFPNYGAMQSASRELHDKGHITYESDIDPVSRFLMERSILGAVQFNSGPASETDQLVQFRNPDISPGIFQTEPRLLSIDIECSRRGDLFSISLYGHEFERVYLIDSEGRKSDTNIRSSGTGSSLCAYIPCHDERELLTSFFDAVALYDPDVFLGWNIVGFDLRLLQERCTAHDLKLHIGADGPAEVFKTQSGSGQWQARIPGRAVLDGPNMLRAAFVTLDDYSLATASTTILGRTKLIEQTGLEKVQEIERQFREDKDSLARYNLEDSRLAYDIFHKLSLHKLAQKKSVLTGLPIDRMGGSAAAFDFLYLPRLHRRGFVAANVGASTEGDHAPGGMVMSGTPGFCRMVAVFDFKSLYPSIIRSFHIDPLAAAAARHELFADTGPIRTDASGERYAMEKAILPEILDELWSERDRAREKNDATLSHAVKIIMNSFYGVLGSTGCRFYDPRLAGSITRSGHWILNYTRQLVEERGLHVLYGDTDSLFVALHTKDAKDAWTEGDELGRFINEKLKEEMSAKFNVESKLNIEFERLFLRFFMPTIRGREIGSKKRYAGLATDRSGHTELYFAGLEMKRRDWTALAREFQRDIFELMFSADDIARLEDPLIQLVRQRKNALFRGELDALLEYRKGLSKKPREYTKNIPPHVRAALKDPDFNGRVIRYVMTGEGPEPLRCRSGSPLDYEHYSEKQLAPIADMLLYFFKTNYEEITGEGRQMSLF